MDYNVRYSQSEGWRNHEMNFSRHKQSTRVKPRPHTASLRRNNSSTIVATRRPNNHNNKRPSTAVGIASVDRFDSINTQRPQQQGYNQPHYQQQQEEEEETMEDIEYGRMYLKHLRIITSPRASFDAGNKTHPAGTITRPRKLPRSPIKKKSREKNMLHNRNVGKMQQPKKNLDPIIWGLGRQFIPSGLSKEELQDSIFQQWISGYNNEKLEYRSASVEIDTSFANANVFTENLPPANPTIISVALSNFDKLIQICGRYRR